MYALVSVLMVPVIAAITGGSVVLISKVGGKAAAGRIKELNGHLNETVNN